MVGSKAFDFYVLSWGYLSETSMNLVETAQRKSQMRTRVCCHRLLVACRECLWGRARAL
jgi:hypothetical protein